MSITVNFVSLKIGHFARVKVLDSIATDGILIFRRFGHGQSSGDTRVNVSINAVFRIASFTTQPTDLEWGPKNKRSQKCGIGARALS